MVRVQGVKFDSEHVQEGVIFLLLFERNAEISACPGLDWNS